MILWLAGTPAYLNAGAELSTYFEGQKAVDEATGTPRFHILRLESSYVGDEEYDGLLCHHVRLRRVPVRGGGSVIVRDFWIAPDRNFLPIRVAFMETEPGDDGAVPLSTVGLFKDLREIAPGVWYPGEVHWKWQSEITADDRITEPDTVVHHQYRARVTEINHNPDYPAEFFRAIEIPSRSFVAEEEIPAETVAEPVSAETDEIAETSPWWKWPPLYMVSLVAIGIAASCVQRARRRGLQNRKPANPG